MCSTAVCLLSVPLSNIAICTLFKHENIHLMMFDNCFNDNFRDEQVDAFANTVKLDKNANVERYLTNVLQFVWY